MAAFPGSGDEEYRRSLHAWALAQALDPETAAQVFKLLDQTD